MTTKQQSHRNGEHHPDYDDIEYALYCDGFEEQYKQVKEQGLFEVLKVLELDKEHSDRQLVKAIDYFNEKDGMVEKDAPMDFLTDREKRMVHRDGAFRAGLYCMLLSKKFADAIENKSAFIQHSYQYGFDS